MDVNVLIEKIEALELVESDYGTCKYNEALSHAVSILKEFGPMIIEYSRKELKYDDALQIVANTHGISSETFMSLFGKGNDFEMADTRIKEATGIGLWEHVNNDFKGFEKVEEEPKYEVVINGKWLVNMFSNRIAIRFVEKNELVNWGANAYKLTEIEIKEIDERYWPFAVPVEGVKNG